MLRHPAPGETATENGLGDPVAGRIDPGDMRRVRHRRAGKLHAVGFGATDDALLFGDGKGMERREIVAPSLRQHMRSAGSRRACGDQRRLPGRGAFRVGRAVDEAGEIARVAVVEPRRFERHPAAQRSVRSARRIEQPVARCAP